ncbi:MAG: carbamoyltransferase HypF [Planctomycetota bacterium]
MSGRGETIRRRIEVSGVVQGIGFRPFVYQLAQQLRLAGFVRNHSAGVTIEVEGDAASFEEFTTRLQGDPPSLARIDAIEIIVVGETGESQFHIVESATESCRSTPVPPDVSVCDECLAELRDPSDRRFGYPFINCTNCGPRYSIIHGVPYDRPSTTMASFVMCERCAAEYHDPADRRFHAQPNACPDCGPRIWFVDGDARGDDEAFRSAGSQQSGAAALVAFRDAIQRGRIVAVKGIGGFHLACDAASDFAVERLRERKGRVDKPFAVMVADIDTARRFAHVSDDEAGLLESKERPIVLLRRRMDTNRIRLSDQVAPGNDCVGVMLPYSPLHCLLLDELSQIGILSLVMTSGNVSEEPIVRTNQEAKCRLADIADSFLLHDREIHVVCDDSVIRSCCGLPLTIRRSRGYAPLPMRLTSPGPSVLAVGGELKATFCVTRDENAWLSPHIGDMANVETLQTFESGVRHFCDLFRVPPQAVACDLHPGYLSANWARRFAQESNIPLVEVQHHHAHIAALRAEYDCREPVIGICFDGTGYGTDGAIWGGEVMRVDDAGFERLAHLKYVRLPGGDAAITRPYRAALAYLRDAGVAWKDDLPCVAACPAEERTVLDTQLQRQLNCISTSSMGRLFDAVASLIGVRHVVSYEAQAAMELESLAAEEAEPFEESFVLGDGSPIQIDPRPLLLAIVAAVRLGVSRDVIASRFHASIAELIERITQRLREDTGISLVGLSGGVFQNVRLLELTVGRLERSGFQTLTHRQIPANDGGLALGQAVIAQTEIEQRADLWLGSSQTAESLRDFRYA